MGLPDNKIYTLDEYVTLEVVTGMKHEYDHGVVTAMAGGTPEHARLAARTAFALEDALKNKPCKPFSSDLKIKAGGKVVYPDVSVLCPPVKRDPEFPDAILNPKVVFEVLSDSTEAYDRGAKFALYRQNPELTDYVLISSTRLYGETYSRNSDDTWDVRFLQADGSIVVRGMECEIPLASLYEGMELLAENG